MVEHNLSVVENLSHAITVLARGEVLAEGDYATVSRNPDVIEALAGAGLEAVVVDPAREPGAAEGGRVKSRHLLLVGEPRHLAPREIEEERPLTEDGRIDRASGRRFRRHRPILSEGLHAARYNGS
jgi:hypothetical protein